MVVDTSAFRKQTDEQEANTEMVRRFTDEQRPRI
jgi:hypothetical protein